MSLAAKGPAARADDALLNLLSPAAPVARETLSPDQWDRLDRKAQLHRLQPLLHHLHRGDPDIPAAVLAGWKSAHRAAAANSLVLQGELARTVGLLEQAGFAPVALKGAWLAWHGYPHPALRPMRDLDLLLDPETVIPAYELLRREGYRTTDSGELALAEVVRLDKHLPPLESPRGVFVELHQRLWEIDGRTDHAAPAATESRIRARAMRTGGVTYLDPRDLLAHLIIHAVYDHRLDCGPLVLSDITFLLQREKIEWPTFWADARRDGWDRRALLLLAMAARADPSLRIDWPDGEAGADHPLAGAASRLLLQDLDTRQSAGVLATLSAGGLGAFLRRIAGRRKAAADDHATPRNMGAHGGFGRWAGSRLWRTLAELARPQVRRQSRDLARLSQWLDG